MRILKLYARFIPIYLKSKTEHGFGFYADFVGFTMNHLVSFLVIWVMLQRFNTINGWGLYEILLIYTMNMFTYSFAAVFFIFQMRDLEEMIHQGTFDGILTKPVHPFFHIVIRTFGHFFLGDILISIIMFVICFNALDLHFTITSLLYFIAMMIGGILIQASFMVLTGAMSFWFIRSSAISNMVLYSLRGFVDYPISIYNRFVRIILTFIIPYAFVNFYPVQLFLHKPGEALFNPLLQYATPIVGILFFLMSFKIWSVGVNKYQGTGS
jgi:ABC-2 type transport system permease protein